MDQDLSRYYLSLIPKAWDVKPQAYPAHITVVRLGKEDFDAAQPNWGNHEGKLISFTYSPKINTDGTYYWLNCWSSDIGHIRQGLGLKFYREGFNSFHLTIGNVKHLND